LKAKSIRSNTKSTSSIIVKKHLNSYAFLLIMALEAKVSDMLRPLEETGVYLSVYAAANPTALILNAKVTDIFV
jgi:hypothetical protein